MTRESKSVNRVTYQDPEYPVYVVYTDLSLADMPDTGWQWHEDLKIVIINNGTAQVNSDDQSLRLLPGQAILIGRSVMHSLQQFGNTPCSYYSITFHPDFILSSNHGHIHEFYSKMLDAHNLRFMIFDENVGWHSELLDNLNSVITVNMIKKKGYEIATKGYLCLFWSILANHIDDETSKELGDMPASLDEQRIKKAMNYIRVHHAERITLDDIALDVHVSKSECCRCFKRSVGMTPFEYLMKYRIFEAANLLKDATHAQDSIADIATATGFNNLSYFSKLFSKYMNCTPRQYRSSSKTHSSNADFISLR